MRRWEPLGTNLPRQQPTFPPEEVWARVEATVQLIGDDLDQAFPGLPEALRNRDVEEVKRFSGVTAFVAERGS